MPSLSVRFFGVPEIELDGDPVQLNRRHSVALLAYLILTRRPHSRDELAALLSGDSAEDAARKRLRNALADLASNQLAGFLLVTRQSVEFKSDMPVDIDVWHLDDMLVPDARPTAASLDWAADRCDLELLSGVSLPDAPDFELWLLTERENRRQQLTRLTYQRLQQLSWSGRIEAGIELGRRLLSVEPWHEGAHRTLMHLLARNGQLAAALAQFEQCRNILDEELGVDPQPETLELYEKLRRGPVPLQNNLNLNSSERDSLLGRKTELESAIRSLTDPSCRLFTIAGMGGVGKTSLALAAAAQLAAPAPITDDHPFADGIFMVDLASTIELNGRDSAPDSAKHRLVTAIGLALGLVFYGRVDRLDQLIAHLRPKRILLILDNMEPYLDQSPALRAIIQRAPQITILVTSQTLLNVPEEWTMWLAGLDLPGSADDLEDAAASQLFLREAQRVNAHIELDQRPHIVGICRLVGGLPLALKVVAAWSAVLKCSEIERELESTGVLLRLPDARNDDSSLLAVVTATCETLALEDRQALQRLAVFPSRFSVAAAAAIGVDTNRLATLSQRLLVEHLPDGRFTLHPLIRQRALMVLAEDPDAEATARDLHAAHYAALVAGQTPRLSQDPDARAILEAERANIRIAWGRAVETRNGELVRQMLGGLAVWNEISGIHREWSDELASAIARFRSGTDDPGRGDIFARLLVANAEALLWQGRLDEAFPLIAEAHRLADGTDSIALEAAISVCEGRLLRFRGGQPRDAIEILHQARALAKTAGEPRIEATSLLQLSFAEVDNENYREAESFLIRAENGFQAIGDRLDLCRVIQNRGRVNTFRGDFVQGGIHLQQSLHMARQFGNRFVEGYSHLFLGIISDSGYGQHREAEQHFNRTREILRQTGDPYLDGNLHRAIGRNALHAGDLEQATQSFEHALQRARDVNSARAINDSLRCLAQLHCESGDLDSAVSLAQQAQHLSNEQGRRHAAASAQLIAATGHERLGQLAKAELAYAQVYSTAEVLDIPYLKCDAVTGIASVALARGDLELAQMHAEEMLVHLHEHSLAGCEEPGRTVRACVDLLRASGDFRADAVLDAGVKVLEQRLAALPQSRRRRYLWSYPDRISVFRTWADPGRRIEHAEGPVETLNLEISQILESMQQRNSLHEVPQTRLRATPIRSG